MQSPPAEADVHSTLRVRGFTTGLAVGVGMAIGGTCLTALMEGPATPEGGVVLWLTGVTSPALAAGATARQVGSSILWSVGLATLALLGTFLLTGVSDYLLLLTSVGSGGDAARVLWSRFVMTTAPSLCLAATLGLLPGPR